MGIHPPEHHGARSHGETRLSSNTPRYKNPSFQKTYEAMLAMASDPASEMYHQGRPHRGAAHRSAFWDGYAGMKKSANVIPNTLSAVCFQAGKDFFKTNPGIQNAFWTPGVTRQGEALQSAQIVQPGYDYNEPDLRQPTPQQIEEARKSAGLTQEAAAALVHRKSSSRWREWSGGQHHIDLAVWELFLIKAQLRTLK